MALALYDPSSVIILLADMIPVEDVMEGTFIQIVKDDPVFTSTASSDGVYYRKRNSRSSYTISLTLTSSSRTSKILELFLLADQISTVAKFPILVKDTSGSSLFSATTCWIEGQPDLSFGNEVSARTWTIKATEAVINFGDSYGSSSSLEDIQNLIIGSLPNLAGLI